MNSKPDYAGVATGLKGRTHKDKKMQKEFF